MLFVYFRINGSFEVTSHITLRTECLSEKFWITEWTHTLPLSDLQAQIQYFMWFSVWCVILNSKLRIHFLFLIRLFILSVELLIFEVESLELFRILHFHIVVFEQRAFPLKLRLVYVWYKGWVHTEFLILFILIAAAACLVMHIIVATATARTLCFLSLLKELWSVNTFSILHLVEEIDLICHENILIKINIIIERAWHLLLILLLLILLKICKFAQVRLNIKSGLSWCNYIIKYLVSFALPNIFTVKSDPWITLIPVGIERTLTLERLIPLEVKVIELIKRGVRSGWGILEMWII